MESTIYHKLCKVANPDTSVNFIFVIHGIRPSFLYQYVDYSEDSVDCPKTKKILEEIKICLHLFSIDWVHIFHTKQGTLIFNRNVIIEKNMLEYIQYDIDNIKYGELLGYESKLDICKTKNRKFKINIQLHTNDKVYSIYSMICTEDFEIPEPDFSNKISAMNKIVNRINTNMSVTYITKFISNYDIQTKIIHKLSNSLKLTTDEIDILKDDLNNSGFIISKSLLDTNANNIYITPYKEYIISFFSYVMNDPSAHLYPLKRHDSEIMNIAINNWEHSLYDPLLI